MSDTRQGSTQVTGTDRRSRRSQRLLWQALLGLLQDHDWADITIQMICDRADLARSTFYSHYATKQDLLDAGFASGPAEVAAQIAALPADPARMALLDWLVDHAATSQGFLRRVRGTAAGQIIMARFQAMVGSLLANDLAPHGAVSEADLTFVTGGVFARLESWLAQGARDRRGLARHLRKQIDAVMLR